MKYIHNTRSMMGGLLLCGVLLAACNQEETGIDERGVPVRISSEIVPMTGSEPSDDEWNPNDAIGVFMVKAGKGIVVNMASNQQFITPGDGSFTPVQGEILFPLSGEKVDLFSYAPYKDLVYDFIYPISLADQHSAPIAPLLYADRVQNRDAADPLVKFSFKHQLAKLVMKVSAGADLPDLNGLSIKIKGMNTEAEFDLLDGSLAVKSSVAEITPTQADDVTYYALLFPVESELTPSHQVDFTIPGNTYTWNMMQEISKIEKAKIYEFDIVVERTGIRISGTIKDWENTDWKDVSAGNN